MNHRKSHNDYWNTRQISLAISEQCNIIECDIISLRGNILLSHSWRPFKWMTYGYATKYLSFIKSWELNDKLILQIDIKTASEYAEGFIVDINYFRNDRVKILLSANNKWYTGDREKVMMNLYNVCKFLGINVELYSEFKKNNDIETIKLYDKKPWYKKINHF